MGIMQDNDALRSSTKGTEAYRHAQGERVSLCLSYVLTNMFIIIPGKAILLIFNICMIVSSLQQWNDNGFAVIPEDTKTRLQDVFRETFGPVVGEWLAVSMESLQNVADHLNFLKAWNWDCGGVLSLLEWLLLVAMLLLLFLFMSTDCFFWIALKSRKFRIGRPALVKFVVLLVNTLITQIVYIALQVAILLMHHVAVDLIFGGQEDCSLLDRILLIAFARFIGIITALWATLFFLELFAGANLEDMMYTIVLFKVMRMTKTEFVKLVKGVKDSAVRVALLSLGAWNKTLDESFQIAKKAQEFDDDPTDDDNCHETVIELTSKLRTVIWLFLPMLVFMAKLGEATNQPPILIRTSSILLRTPYCVRRILHILNLLLLAFTFVIVFYPANSIVIILFAVLGIWFVYDSAVQSWWILDKQSFESRLYNSQEKQRLIASALICNVSDENVGPGMTVQEEPGKPTAGGEEARGQEQEEYRWAFGESADCYGDDSADREEEEDRKHFAGHNDPEQQEPTPSASRTAYTNRRTVYASVNASAFVQRNPVSPNAAAALPHQNQNQSLPRKIAVASKFSVGPQ
eukprot:ANDGO_01028.mRNA.1 hypothetical protein AMSG_08923